MYKDFYEKAADQFNDKEWIPNSLVIPNLHEDFKKLKPLPLNVTPITAEQLKKLSDNQYKMVKVIVDWERSGSGSSMSRNLLQGRSNDDDDNSIGNSENVQLE